MPCILSVLCMTLDAIISYASIILIRWSGNTVTTFFECHEIFRGRIPIVKAEHQLRRIKRKYFVKRKKKQPCSSEMLQSNPFDNDRYLHSMWKSLALCKIHFLLHRGI